MKIGYIPVSSELGLESAKIRDKEIRSNFSDIVDFETEVIHDASVAKEVAETIDKISLDIVITPVLTGGSEDKIINLAKSKAHIVLIGTMYYNSFPAIMEAISTLQETGKAYTVVNTDIQDLGKLIKVLKTIKQLGDSKLIMFGDPSPWLVYSRPFREIIKQKLGVEIEKIDLSQIVDRYNDTSPHLDILGLEKSPKTTEIKEGEFVRVGKIHKVLSDLVKEHGGDFFTIRCFDLIKELKTTPCLSLAVFNDEGLTAGCEGDVPSVISMRIAQLLTGKPAFMANTLKINGDEITIAHCTIATRLTRNYTLRTHFESGMGIGVQGVLAEGEKVTLFKIDPKIEKMYIGNGVILDGKPFSDELCRTQVTIKLEGNAINALRMPMGNHVVVAFGDISEELSLLSSILGIETREF